MAWHGMAWQWLYGGGLFACRMVVVIVMMVVMVIVIVTDNDGDSDKGGVSDSDR